MKRVAGFFKKEFLEMLPPTIFFLVVFHMTAYIRGLTVQEFGITLESVGYATVGALIVGKAILIANKLSFVHIFRRYHGLITVIWKVFIYSVFVVVFQYLEHIVPMTIEKSFVEASEHLSANIYWPKFWATHLIMVIFLTFYVVIVEVMEAIGKDAFWAIFLTRNEKDDPKPAAAAAQDGLG